MQIAEKIILTSLTILIYVISFRLLIEFIISYNQSSFNKNKPFFRYLFMVTEPFSIPFRRILPPSATMDISPIFAIASLIILLELLSAIFFQFHQVFRIT